MAKNSIEFYSMWPKVDTWYKIRIEFKKKRFRDKYIVTRTVFGDMVNGKR